MLFFLLLVPEMITNCTPLKNVLIVAFLFLSITMSQNTTLYDPKNKNDMFPNLEVRSQGSSSNSAQVMRSSRHRMRCGITTPYT